VLVKLVDGGSHSKRQADIGALATGKRKKMEPSVGKLAVIRSVRIEPETEETRKTSP